MKVCILTAGRGSRMGFYQDVTHKALLPLGDQAILSHIIDQFPQDAHFVFALGHCADDVKAYINIMHGNLSKTFINIEGYDQPGSGPGDSLWQCRDALNEPFYFTSCDTLIRGSLPQDNKNWMGTQQVDNPALWCSARLNSDDHVTDLYYKEDVDVDHAFVGLAYVHDAHIFWQGMQGNTELRDQERQVNAGLEALAKQSQLKAIDVDWIDTGNEEHYRLALKEFGSISDENKRLDLTYRKDDVIVKNLASELSAAQRFRRAKAIDGVYPEVIDQQEKLLSYKFVEGELLSHHMSAHQCCNFLNWMQNHFWQDCQDENFIQNCKNFYQSKTLSRLKLFHDTFHPQGEASDLMINDVSCATVQDMITNLNDDFFDKSYPSTFHGDLHAENILITQDGYRLLDWRDCFGNSEQVGDRYYDLAKFWHVLDLSVNVMQSQRYSAHMNENGSISLAHDIDTGERDAQEAFKQFAQEQGYCMQHIDLLNGIIFVNMAPLYQQPMADYLYFLGRLRMNEALLESSSGIRSKA